MTFELVHVNLLHYRYQRFVMGDDREITSNFSSNCSGHGSWDSGSCYCQIHFKGDNCEEINIPYFLSFGIFFFVLSLTTLIQLAVCIKSDYLRLQKKSLWNACRMTMQKVLYILTILATVIRGSYFILLMKQGDISSQLAINLMSAYYPILLTGFSLIVCFWAEVFHLTGIRCDRPRLLSKSFVAYTVFNVVLYVLLIMQVLATEIIIDHQYQEYVNSIFNGCFAFLMLCVVIAFLIYGVEMYFKVHGAFAGWDNSPVDFYQLRMSRLGLVVQASLQLITALFLVSDVLKNVWEDKIPTISRNYYDVIFRIVEFGVALWFPCVLWNCSKPDELWVLNPRKILKTFDFEEGGERENLIKGDKSHLSYEAIQQDKALPEVKDCWICYDPDRSDMGTLIQPCDCKGDVSMVHHECLRKWLLESADNPSNIQCRVCKKQYILKEGKMWLPHGLKARHWIQNGAIVMFMLGCPVGTYAICRYISKSYVQILAIGVTVLLEYICMKLLGFSAVSAYKRARISSIRILGKETSNREPTSRGSEFEVLTKDNDGASNLGSCSNVNIISRCAAEIKNDRTEQSISDTNNVARSSDSISVGAVMPGDVTTRQAGHLQKVEAQIEMNNEDKS